MEKGLAFTLIIAAIVTTYSATKVMDNQTIREYDQNYNKMQDISRSYKGLYNMCEEKYQYVGKSELEKAAQVQKDMIMLYNDVKEKDK